MAQCCDPTAVKFSLEFDDPEDDPLEPIDGAPLSAYFDEIVLEEMSHPIRLTAIQVTGAGALATLGDLSALEICNNTRLRGVMGIVQTVD